MGATLIPGKVILSLVQGWSEIETILTGVHEFGLAGAYSVVHIHAYQAG